MARLWNVLRMDLTLISRDPVVLYMAVAPVLLALAFVAVIGGAGSGTITFAIDATVPSGVVRSLESVGRVERVAGRDELVARVERMDSVAGVSIRGGSPALLLEGNEPPGFAEQAESLLARAVAGDIPAFVNRRVASTGGIVVSITQAGMLLLAVFLAGAIAGLAIVAERESGAMRALAVSPLDLTGLVAARTVLALLLAALGVGLTATALGLGGHVPVLLLVTLASAPVVALIALVLGVTASNQIVAFATMKMLVPAGLLLPISSTFVPDAYERLYWWLPTYWQFKAVEAGMAGRVDAMAAALMLVTGSLWLAVVARTAVTRLGMRWRTGRVGAERGRSSRLAPSPRLNE
jgi:ABC-2 type transport system permease protein